MSKYFSVISGLILAVICVGFAPDALAQDTTQTAVLHFTFRDSSRGTTVRPDAVLVDNEVVFNRIDEAGHMSVPVAPGDHRVLIKAAGYNDLDSRQTAALDQAPMNLIMLDPAQPPEELLPENLSTGMPANGTVITGFITDYDMGKPLPGAEIKLLEQDVITKADERGFFKLPVAMPDGLQMPEDPRGSIFATRNFRVSMPGYGFEDRLNVLVESGTPRVYQVQMIRGGGGNTLDESGGRNNLQSSLFGLTNVEPEDPPTSASMPADGVPVTPAATAPSHTAQPAPANDHDHDHDHSDDHSH